MGRSTPTSRTHWREITHYADIPLDPDIDTYNTMEVIGALRCFTAREQGRLVGYAVFFIRHNLHYRSSLQAMQDVLFVLPEHRGRVGHQTDSRVRTPANFRRSASSVSSCQAYEQSRGASGSYGV
jgi:hypothetical protein